MVGAVCVWLGAGSTTLTATGLTLNANNRIVIADTTLSTWPGLRRCGRGSLHEDKADSTAHLLDWDGTEVESFSPTGLAAFEVWDEAANADQTIQTENFAGKVHQSSR
jgi:hypothetical protein